MQSGHDNLKTAGGVLRAIRGVVSHLAISTMGVIFLSNVLISFLYTLAHIWYPSVTSRQVHWILTEVHGFPVQAAFGLLLGFVLAKYMRRKVMVWIWVLPLAFLCIAILFSPRYYSSIFDHFFGSGCTPAGHCFDQLGLTMPLVSSAAYSLGAKLRRNTS
jgi:hypothetical protein